MVHSDYSPLARTGGVLVPSRTLGAMATPSSRRESGRSTSRTVASHLAVMAVVSAILGVLVAGLAIPFAGVLGIGTRNVANSMNDLPESLETKALSQRTRILAADGTTIATLYDENRVNVSLKQVSRVMREAIVSIEDYRFYQHLSLIHI